MLLLWIAQGSGSAPAANVAPDFITPLITGGAVVLGALISGIVSSVTIHFNNRHQRILAQEQYRHKMQEEAQSRFFAFEDAKRERLREAALQLLLLAKVWHNAVREAEVNLGFGEAGQEQAKERLSVLRQKLEAVDENKWVVVFLLDGGDDIGAAFDTLVGSTILYFFNAQRLSPSVQDRRRDAEQVYKDFEGLKTLLARYLSFSEIKGLQPGEGKEHTPTI